MNVLHSFCSTKPQTFMLKIILGIAFISVSFHFFTSFQKTTRQFPTPELTAFHSVLHPLIHEALPKKDMVRIRSNVKALDQARKKVAKMRLPQMNQEDEKNVRELMGFVDASTEEFIKAVHNKASDEEIQQSLEAVHEEFVDLVEAIEAAR